MDQALYKISSAMKRLDVSRATIYRLAGRGELEMVKIGSCTRVTGESLDRVIAAGKMVAK